MSRFQTPKRRILLVMYGVMVARSARACSAFTVLVPAQYMNSAARPGRCRCRALSLRAYSRRIQAGDSTPHALFQPGSARESARRGAARRPPGQYAAPEPFYAGPATGAGADGSEADDDEGGVVGGAAGRKEVEEDRVGEGLGVGVLVAGEGAGEAGEARVDVLAAAFDESVGVENEGVPFGEAGGGLGTSDVFRAGAERGVGGLVEELDAAVGAEQGGWEVTGAAVGESTGVPVDVGLDCGGVLGAGDGAGVQPEDLQGLGGAIGDEEAALRALRSRPMMPAACRPWPTTSPTATAMRSPGRSTRSYQSPQTLRAPTAGR